MPISSTSSLVDSHCHLNFDVFDHDRDLIVERARNNGITRIVNPGVDIETSASALHYTRIYPEVFAAVGIHPNSGSTWSKASLLELHAMLCEEKVVAVGEIGLDYYRHQCPRDLQISIFKQQLGLAAELGVPVIVHNREAASDILEILSKWHQELVVNGSALQDCPGVVHSFSGDGAFATQLVALNFKLGINGPVTFNNSQMLQSVVTAIPVESLLVETDAPFLSPQPYRGKRNEPANVRIVAEKIAQLKDEQLDSVAKITTAEADRLFRWREIH